MKIGRQEETVDLLVVDDLDYDLVIGNDILRDKFRAGIDAGTKQHIRLNSGSKVPYCTSVDPVRPDESRRLPIQIAEHQLSPHGPSRTSASSSRHSSATILSSRTSSASSTRTRTSCSGSFIYWRTWSNPSASCA